MKLKYNFDYIKKYCEENNIVLLEDYSDQHLNSLFVIKTKCSNIECDKKCEKEIRQFFINSLCKDCSAIKRLKTLEQNNLAKYGYKNVFQIPEIKDKLKETCLNRYGVENPSMNEDIKDKKKKTLLKNYGVENMYHSEVLVERLKKSIREKYGVDNVSQNPDISEKQQKSYKIKDYVLPSGRVLHYQGYENFALDKLIYEDKIDESQIITSRKEVPHIYYYMKDDENKKHIHFVDIYIKNLNKCIEVKSTWTFKKHYEKVLAKQKAGKEQGLLYEIIVYDVKGKIVEHLI